MAELSVEEKAKQRLLKFQEAKKKAEEQKNRGNFPKEEVPDFKTVVLKKEQPRIIRLVGNSPLMRENPTDSLIIKRAFVKTDDDKWANIIMPEDRDNPINKLWRTIIGKYKYNKDTKTRVYDNKGKPSFERFIRNGKKPEDCLASEKGMTPDTFYLFNCIDRTDSWCEENKHTKLLCWDSTTKEVDGKTVEYPVYGIKPSLYNNIFDVQCTKLIRMFDEFDVVVKRLKEKLGDSYLTVCIPEERTSIKNMGLDPDKVTMNYLTDEEEAYERYKLEDIPFVSRPTSVSYVLKIVPKLIKQCDIDFKTNLYEEFVEWAEKEKKEREAKKAETKETESTEDTSAEVESEDEEVTEETTSTETPNFDSMKTVETESSEDDELPSEVEEPTPTVTKTKKVVKSAFDIISLYDKHPHLKELTDEEKSLIVGYEDNKFKYKEGIDIAQCPTCLERLLKEGYSEEEIDKLSLADIADDFKTCPYCGQKF